MHALLGGLSLFRSPCSVVGSCYCYTKFVLPPWLLAVWFVSWFPLTSFVSLSVLFSRFCRFRGAFPFRWDDVGRMKRASLAVRPFIAHPLTSCSGSYISVPLRTYVPAPRHALLCLTIVIIIIIIILHYYQEPLPVNALCLNCHFLSFWYSINIDTQPKESFFSPFIPFMTLIPHIVVSVLGVLTFRAKYCPLGLPTLPCY